MLHAIIIAEHIQLCAGKGTSNIQSCLRLRICSGCVYKPKYVPDVHFSSVLITCDSNPILIKSPQNWRNEPNFVDSTTSDGRQVN